MVERGSQGAGRGLVVAGRCGVGTSCESGSCTYRDAILAVVDAATVGEDVDVGTLGSKLAVSLRDKTMVSIALKNVINDATVSTRKYGWQVGGNRQP